MQTCKVRAYGCVRCQRQHYEGYSPDFDKHIGFQSKHGTRFATWDELDIAKWEGTHCVHCGTPLTYQNGVEAETGKAGEHPVRELTCVKCLLG